MNYSFPLYEILSLDEKCMEPWHCCWKPILYFNFLILPSPLKSPTLGTGLCWPPLKGVFHFLCCDDNRGSRTSHFPLKLSRELEWKLPWTADGRDSTPESALLYADVPLLLISFHFKWFLKKIEAICFSNYNKGQRDKARKWKKKKKEGKKWSQVSKLSWEVHFPSMWQAWQYY